MSDSGISGSARVNLPEEYSIDFNHEGGLTNFNNKAIVIYGNKKHSTNAEFLIKGKKAEGHVVFRILDEPPCYVRQCMLEYNLLFISLNV